MEISKYGHPIPLSKLLLVSTVLLLSFQHYLALHYQYSLYTGFVKPDGKIAADSAAQSVQEATDGAVAPDKAELDRANPTTEVDTIKARSQQSAEPGPSSKAASLGLDQVPYLAQAWPKKNIVSEEHRVLPLYLSCNTVVSFYD